MKLYRYEIDSDDDENDVINFKIFVAEFSDRAAAVAYIETQYSPLVVTIKPSPLTLDCEVLYVTPADLPDTSLDEVLWLIA